MFGPFPLADPTDERQIPIEMLFFGPLLPIGLMTSFPQLCLQLRIRTQRLDRIAQFMAIPVKEPAPLVVTSSDNAPMSLAITGVLNEGLRDHLAKGLVARATARSPRPHGHIVAVTARMKGPQEMSRADCPGRGVLAPDSY